MTVTTVLAPATGRRAGLRQQVASEFTKIRSVRSTWVVVGLMLAISLGFAALFPAVIAHNWSHRTPTERLSFDPVSITQLGIIFGQLVIAVFAVLTVCPEFSTGSIRSTLAAQPRRLDVLAAKAIVLAGVTFVLSEVCSFSAFFLGRAVLLASGGQAVSGPLSIEQQLHSAAPPVLSIGSSGVAVSVFGGGLYLTLIALLALGLGFALRSTPGSIALFVALLLIIPGVLQALPHSISDKIQPRLPSNLGAAMTSVHQRTTDFGGHLMARLPATGLMALYSLALLALGWWLFARRDA
jgi:ABC-2 type transport system permease protein